MSGSGNDFICIDNRDGTFDEILSSPQRIGHFAITFCHRGTGAGADGIIFACTPEIEGVADIAARFFEPDGSPTELCGNGTASFVHWVSTNNWVPEGETKILTPAGVVLAQNRCGSYVRVCIPLPEDMQTNQKITAGEKSWMCDYVVTGVPHLVVYVDNVDEVDIPHWGPIFRYHERFAPRGVNVNFVQILGEGEFAMRTWEYGVEGETLACGTGSAAAAVLAAKRFDWDRRFRNKNQPVLVRARSGDTLRILLTEEDDGSISDLCLETIVRFMYFGTAHPSLISKALNRTAES